MYKSYENNDNPTVKNFHSESLFYCAIFIKSNYDYCEKKM